MAAVFGYVLDGPVTHPGLFTPVPGGRVMDTRLSPYPGAPNKVVPPHGIVTLNLSSAGFALPRYLDTPVTLNVTVTRPTAGGYITVYPGGGSRPLASTLNFRAGDTVANLTMVKAHLPGTVSFYNGSSGTVQLVADVSGYMQSPREEYFSTSTRFGRGQFAPSVSCPTSSFCLASSNQGRVSMMLPGILRDNPDYFSVIVMNDILGGGGFTSRIMSRVRSDEGLAYSAYSSFPGGTYYPLTFTAGFQS